MTVQPLISVITPTAVCGPHVRRAVESVREQDHPHVEHVVVGDACTGAARARLDALADGPASRVPLRVLNASTPALDVASYRPARAARVRTVGAGAARGELLAFLDDDCEFEPGHLTEMVRTLVEQPHLEAVHCWRRIVRADGSPYLAEASPWESDPGQARREYDDLVAAGVWVAGTNLLRDRLEAHTVDSSCWLLRRHLLDRVPFRWHYTRREREAHLGEDVAFCFDLRAQGTSVGCVEQDSVRYYLGGFSTCGTRDYGAAHAE